MEPFSTYITYLRKETPEVYGGETAGEGRDLTLRHKEGGPQRIISSPTSGGERNKSTGYLVRLFPNNNELRHVTKPLGTILSLSVIKRVLAKSLPL